MSETVRDVIARAIAYTIKRYEVCTSPIHDFDAVEAASDIMQTFTPEDIGALSVLASSGAVVLDADQAAAARRVLNDANALGESYEATRVDLDALAVALESRER